MDNVNCGVVHNPIKGKLMVSFGRDGWIGFRQADKKLANKIKQKNSRQFRTTSYWYDVIRVTKAKWMVPFQRYGLRFRQAEKTYKTDTNKK